MQPKTILCFIDFYNPSTKSGGATRSLNNIISELSYDYNFLVFTRDRDMLDKNSFSDISPNEWNQLPKHEVFYASPLTLNIFHIAKIIMKSNCDCIYLNSFFSYKMTLLPLLINFLFLRNAKKILVAPRGEFSEGALRLKNFKKIVYLYFVKLFKIFDNVSWQASSLNEQAEIIRVYSKSNGNIFIAPDLISLPSFSNFKKIKNYSRRPGALRAIFLSRITRKKNLHFLLNLLRKIKGNLVLNIYGPIEDRKYWHLCEKLILNIPSNIKVKYKGAVNPKQSLKFFSYHDLFIFPTHGESFGHVIFESLASGTSVILSNQTPWQKTYSGVLEILDLGVSDLWVNSIENWISYNEVKLLKNRKASLAFANKFINNNQTLMDNKIMFKNLFSL